MCWCPFSSYSVPQGNALQKVSDELDCLQRWVRALPGLCHLPPSRNLCTGSELATAPCFRPNVRVPVLAHAVHVNSPCWFPLKFSLSFDEQFLLTGWSFATASQASFSLFCKERWWTCSFLRCYFSLRLPHFDILVKNSKVPCVSYLFFICLICTSSCIPFAGEREMSNDFKKKSNF